MPQSRTLQNRDYVMCIGCALLEQGFYFQAARCFLSVVEEYPADMYATFLLRHALESTGQIGMEGTASSISSGNLAYSEYRSLDKEAIDFLRALLHSDSGYTRMERHLCHAIRAYMERRLSDAEMYLCAALEWQPENSALQAARALLLIERGYCKDALRILEALVREESLATDDYYLQAVTAWRCRNMATAERACRAVLAHSPSHRNAMRLLAAISLKRGQFWAALPLWFRATFCQRR